MSMTESDVGNDRWGGFEEVFLHALPYFSCRQRGCRIREEAWHRPFSKPLLRIILFSFVVQSTISLSLFVFTCPVAIISSLVS